MDDCCAVCAEPLEWVSYGPCFHRDVCSTCVSRLRFICHDRRCCICKTPSDVVFVTKALGDYTRMINDFSSLPSDVREGRVGSYWYHEDTNAFFDDVDHYKMIKAMCRLSCSICDKLEVKPHDASKRRAMYRNIEQLKGHLFHNHKLVMCSLCLEGRKVFICEQKLFTRLQLSQHISTGDSEVDGSESERGGFMGHPMCEFCRKPFYGDNELFTHMSREHYTCHICQRRHPGQYEYYKNYDDLEIHFRQEHFLCEDEACLAEKFIVFQSEQEMKRHNAIKHGGRMSRSKRNAALQIPTSFRYRHGNEQDRRHGRGRTFHRDSSESHLSMAIEASLLETANAEHMFHDLPASDTGQVDVDNRFANIDSVQPLESSASSRYLQVVGQNSSGAPLENSSFPPLPKASRKGKQKSKHGSEGSSSNTMAAHLRQHRNVSVINSAHAWPAASRAPVRALSNPAQSSLPTTAPGVGRNSGPAKTVANSAPAPSTYASSSQPMQRTAQRSHYNGGIVHSASAPTLIQRSPVAPSITDFPPVSAAQVRKLATTSQSLLNAEDVHTANKLLVEKIRSALDFDEDRYSLFKDFSAQYRQGMIDTPTYLDYVQQFGLSHIVHELARLCPDVQKQKELVESYNASLRRNGIQENGSSHTGIHRKNGDISRKIKGKSVDAGESNPKERLADSFLSTVRQLHLNNNLSEEKVEVLSRGDYRTDKGKSKIEQQIDKSSGGQSMGKYGGGQSETSSGSVSKPNREDKGGGNKQRKKTSKFLRARLGDTSAESTLDIKNSQTDSGPKTIDGLGSNRNDPGGMPVRGVWKNSGGKKLFS